MLHRTLLQAHSRDRHTYRIPPGKHRGQLWACGGLAGVAGSAISERVATLPAASGPDSIVTAGPVMAIGGAEDKFRDKVILSAFVNLAGGPDARVAIVPTASSIEEAGERYKALFLGMGAESADVLYLPDRAAAASPEIAEVLDDVTGIFLTGGNQMRLASIVAGTPVARKVRSRNMAGVVVAGTNIQSDIHRVKGHGAITVSGAILHVLGAGNHFDMVERRLLPNESWNRVVEKPRRRR